MTYIETKGNKIEVYTPYEKTFVDFAHEHDGKWNASDKAWVFDIREKEAVEKICVRLFNYIVDGDREITIQFPGTLLECHGNGEQLLNCQICYRPGRDSRVRLTDGCLLVSGKFSSSGGSMRYPHCGDVDDIIFEYRKFPKSRLPELEEYVKYCGSEEYWFKVIDEVPADVDALKAEKEKLEKRLKEIDEILASAKNNN